MHIKLSDIPEAWALATFYLPTIELPVVWSLWFSCLAF